MLIKLIVIHGYLGSVKFYILIGNDWGCFKLELYAEILTGVINSPS